MKTKAICLMVSLSMLSAFWGCQTDKSIEARVLEGEKVRVDMDALIESGLEIDIDGDGVKNKLTAEKNEYFGESYSIFIDGEDMYYRVSNNTEAWFVNLFDKRIDIASMGTESLSYRDVTLVPEDDVEPKGFELSNAIVVSGLSAPTDYWRCLGCDMVLFSDSVDDLKHCDSVEDYIDNGAVFELNFPDIGSTDADTVMTVNIDLDRDGTAEKITLTPGTITFYEDENHTKPIETIKYDDEIFEEAAADGRYFTFDDATHIAINGKEPDSSVYIPYGRTLILTKDGEGKIKIVMPDAIGCLIIGWESGEITSRVVCGTEGLDA